MEMHRLDVKLLEAFVDRIIYLNASQECTREDVVVVIEFICREYKYGFEKLGKWEYATYLCKYSYKISFNEETVLVSISDACVGGSIGFLVKFFIKETEGLVSTAFVAVSDTDDVMIANLKAAIDDF